MINNERLAQHNYVLQILTNVCVKSLLNTEFYHKAYIISRIYTCLK